jgi:hypothetical protein
MFHNVIVFSVRPSSGSASNETSAQAIATFQPPAGIVNAARHTR